MGLTQKESPADKGRPHGPGPEGDAHPALCCFPKNVLLKKCIEETWMGRAAGNLVAQFRECTRGVPPQKD